MSEEPAPLQNDGYAELSNRLISLGILAHLRPKALKLYLALLHAARKSTRSCWPGLKTLSRWTGISRGQISAELGYLAGHGLILREWIQIGGKPRRLYRIVPPDMFTDVRDSCAYCMRPDHRDACVLRDPATGRLLGKVAKARVTDHRDSHVTDHRDRDMSPDHRDTKHSGSSREGMKQPRRVQGGEEPEPALKWEDPDALQHQRQVMTLVYLQGPMPERLRVEQICGKTIQQLEPAVVELAAGNGGKP